MITETAPVEAALAPLRSRGCRIDIGELVTLGARSKLEQLEREAETDARRRELRDELLALTEDPATFDLDSILDVRERGWLHEG
jgi:hypothetical protein